jgi:hypothetical protein
MKILRTASFLEIILHMQGLGGGNQSDNEQSISGFQSYFLGELSETEFFGLVFLASNQVHSLVPSCADRRLLAVAERAIQLCHPQLSDNWDLNANLMKFHARWHGREDIDLPALVLRDARNSELPWGKWYLQDGGHRAIAYATLLLSHELEYHAQLAFCATQYSLQDIAEKT